MEADLAFRGVDLRDLWRPGKGLTLRRVAVLVAHLPAEAATTQLIGGSGWTITDILLSDVYHAVAGKRHPARPAPPRRAKHTKRGMDTKLLAQERRRDRELTAMHSS